MQESCCPHCNQFIWCVFRPAPQRTLDALSYEQVTVSLHDLDSDEGGRKLLHHFFCVKSNASCVRNLSALMELTNSLIFQAIKMSSSIQDSDLSCNLNSFLLARWGLIQGEQPASRAAVVAAHHRFHSVSPVQTPPEREGGGRRGRSQGVTPAMWVERILSPVPLFYGSSLGTSLNITGPPAPSYLK